MPRARSCRMLALAAPLDIDSVKGPLMGIPGARQPLRCFPAIPTKQSYLWFRSVSRQHTVRALRLRKIGTTRSDVCISDGKGRRQTTDEGGNALYTAGTRSGSSAVYLLSSLHRSILKWPAILRLVQERSGGNATAVSTRDSVDAKCCPRSRRPLMRTLRHPSRPRPRNCHHSAAFLPHLELALSP